MLLEGRATAYIQDRGVSRWDTCAAEAVLRAHGGQLVQLHGVLEGAPEESARYHYRTSDVNQDFIEGLSRLTPYNCRSGVLPEGPHLCFDGLRPKPYSNLLGLFAVVDRNAFEELAEAVRAAAYRVAPSFV